MRCNPETRREGVGSLVPVLPDKEAARWLTVCLASGVEKDLGGVLAPEHEWTLENLVRIQARLLEDGPDIRGRVCFRDMRDNPTANLGFAEFLQHVRHVRIDV